MIMDAAQAVSFNEPTENAVYNALLEFFGHGGMPALAPLADKHEISFTRLENGIRKAMAIAAQRGIDLSLLAREGNKEFPKPGNMGPAGSPVRSGQLRR